ncbi:MAG: NAD(P)/FAD-dependent oxidoreductase [Chloroflexota bacterium]
MSKVISVAESSARPKLVILGGGFAGVYFLLRLLKRLKHRHAFDVTLVSDENFFMFTPLLHEVATGGIETRHITFPIRRLKGRHEFTFIQARVNGIDLTRRSVATTAGEIGYDRLVIALGSDTDISGLPPGAKRVFRLRALWDGILLRNHVIKCFEQADAEHDPARQRQLLTFVVSGGGYIGVQYITALQDFVHRSLIKYYPRISRDMVRIIILQPSERLLTNLPSYESEYTLRVLKKRGVEVRFNARVTASTDDGVRVNGEPVPTGTLVWVTGVMANHVVASLPVEKDHTGRVVVNGYFELPDYPGVMVLGDCAHFVDPATGETALPRAHNALRQAWVAADNLAAEVTGKPQRPYRNPFSGGLVSLGTQSAVINAYGFRLHGFIARVIWLVAYSSLLTSTYNRVRVISDWLLTLFFGRDTSMLEVR